MLVKLDEVLLTKIGFLVVTSVFIFRSTKQTKKKMPLSGGYGQMRINPLEITWNCQRHGLTGRETEVTMLLCQHFKHREIADRLFISARTVNKHVENIFGKTDVTSRSDLVRMVQGQQR